MREIFRPKMPPAVVWLLPLVAVVVLSAALAPAPHGSLPEWKALPVAMAEAEQQKKFVWVHVYTEWCAWCRIMEKQALHDPKTMAYLNQHFVPAKLDAWERKPIHFMGHTFRYLPERSYHELAHALLEGEMNYPTTVILTPKGEILSTVPGFLDIPSARKLLLFYAEGLWETENWEFFKKNHDY